jgi:hypothetical protein
MKKVIKLINLYKLKDMCMNILRVICILLYVTAYILLPEKQNSVASLFLVIAYISIMIEMKTDKLP